MRRRELLSSAAAAGLLAACAPGTSSAGLPEVADGKLETTTLRTARLSSLCLAPQYLAEESLRAEGFTDLRYVETTSGENRKLMADRQIDLTMDFSAKVVKNVDQGDHVVVLGGVHVGCFEIFGAESVKNIRDLKGRTVAVPELGVDSSHYAFMASVLAHVGLDARTDVTFVQRTFPQVMEQLPQGKVDAFIGFPPQPQELRAKGIGRVLLDSMSDRPWSGYYCCMLTAHTDFVAKNPVATLRAMRAILRATDTCAKEPERAARFLIDRKYAANYDYAVAAMRNLPYGVWRDVEPEDTLRFYALRLGEAGSVKGTPDKIIAGATDWRFLRALKKELS